MAEQQSFLGLGAARASSSNSERIGRDECVEPNPSLASNGTTTTNAADDLVARYMKQCMDYHKEQVQLLEHVKREEQQNQPTVIPNGTIDTNAPIRSSSSALTVPSHPPPTTPSSTPTASISLNHESSPTTTTTTLDLQKRIQTARAIAHRLASTTPPPPSTPHTSTSTSTTDNTYPYSQKRNHFLTTIHQKRLTASLLKNFSYLVEKDTELHQRQLRVLEVTKEREVGLKLREERVGMERRRGLLQQQQGGGGTKGRKRNRFGEVPKGVVAGIGTQERKSAQRDNLAVYVTGLPRGGGGGGGSSNRSGGTKNEKLELSKELEKVTLEKILRQLFGSYGIVSRVMLYVDKQTGMRKGDGLVVYDYPRSRSVEDGGDDCEGGTNATTGRRDSFLEMVCSQLNGAELPCGSVLSVEPADMDYNKKDALKKNEMTRTDENETKIGAISSTTATSVMNDDTVGENTLMKNDSLKEEEKDGDDDLDDFFASLE